MTNLDHCAWQPQAVVRAATFALVVVAVLMQSLLGAVHPYQHGAGVQGLTPAWTQTADATNSAQQALAGHGDQDDAQCALCLALHASSNCVGFKATLFIAPGRSRDCYLPGPACGPLDSRRYALAQQRAPPLTV
jgi:hypothetical protein